MKGNDFAFENIVGLQYKCHKISLNRSGSNTFSRLEKNTKATMILKNKDDKCFQCTVKVELNHENIKNLLEKISKIKLFINQSNWEKKIFMQDPRTGKGLTQIIKCS